jgi:diacylglycerol kinase family enzyme
MGNLQAGVRLLRQAEPGDGVLDVAVLAPHTLRHWLALAASVLVRRRNVPHMEIFMARAVDVHAPRPQPRELDGDVIDTDHDLSVEVLPQALLLCVP